ncbi:hypothetical protein D3C79_396030 [compost metagenome]
MTTPVVLGHMLKRGVVALIQIFPCLGFGYLTRRFSCLILGVSFTHSHRDRSSDFSYLYRFKFPIHKPTTPLNLC